MITPNGRFATQKRICMSMSDFHPETWNPMWSVSSILTGLLSFMMDNTPTTGSVSTSDVEKQRLAQNSLAFNCKSVVFRKMFPEYVEKHLERQRAAEQVVAEQANQNGVHVSCTLNSSGPQSDTLTTANNGHVERKGRQQKPSEKFPFWLTALIVAVFASIMALPLLTLDLTHS